MRAIARISLRPVIRRALIVLPVLVLAACASSAPRYGGPQPISPTVLPAAAAGPPGLPADGMQTAVPPADAGTYRIHPGDNVIVKFFRSPDLNEEVTVRPDGRISLHLAHDVMAAGLLPSELERVLAERMSGELRKPRITVSVRSFNAPVFVDGEVFRTGAFQLVGSMTVLQAIAHAGGMRDTAREDEVVVIRRGPRNEPVPIQVNVKKARGGRSDQDIVLQPYDVVFVPRKAIANVNAWVDQYIRRNLPLGMGFGYTIP